jgi:DNA-binding SARP family transcriptional activator/tetratricopeptide (TPR) repeat protein
MTMWVGVLGALTVRDDDRHLPVPAGKQRTVLAALAMRANQAVTLNELADIVWDASPPASANATLRNYVKHLRHALGSDRLLTARPGYLIRLDEPELDVACFESLVRQADTARHEDRWLDVHAALTEALSLWRGSPLADIRSDTLRHEHGPRLEQLRLQALEVHVEADLHLGRHEQVVPELLDLTLRYPLRERFHAQLVLALYRCGRAAEALDTYRQARRVLVEELGIEPGPELQSLHQSVLSGDPALSASPSDSDSAIDVEPRAVAARPVAEVPRQLPAVVGHFVGRRSELELLTTLTDRTAEAAGTGTGTATGTGTGGAVVISAIDGMAGIGKTALAVCAAHRLAEKFPDGQLFLDLHGYTQGRPPRTAGEALTWLLAALGVPPERIPKDSEQAAALYRQRLADTRTLIVLDNAVTEAQVRPLLPGGDSCLVLVTSRRRLKALDDAHTVALDLLSPPDAVALLRAVAGPGRIPPDDPLADEVAGLCGYLPLALRIAASLLRHRQAWPLEHLAEQLRDQRQRVAALSDGERELAAVFDLSYTSLDEQHRHLWRRLGLIPGPDLDARAAAALAELDPTIAAGLLENLVDHNLLSAYASGRYRLHDLLRAHARTLAATDPAPDREAALSRLLHYYADIAQSASIPIARNPRPQPDGSAPALTDPEAARTWLRTERSNLEAAFTHAHTHGLDGHAIAVAAALAEILQTDGPWSRALEIHQSAAETAERVGNAAAQANALNDLGRVRYMAGDFPGAGDAVSQALEIYRALGNRLGEANALNDLGRVRYLTGDYPGAGNAVTQALEIYRALGNRLGEANALNNLGRVRHLTGDYPGADDALTQALEIYRALGNRHGEANALAELGRVRHLIGDFRGADDAVSQALEIHRALGNRLGEATALTNLAKVRCLVEDFSGADDALTQALEIYRTLSHRLGEANALTNLGKVRNLTGAFSGADDALTRALEIYRELGHRSNEAWALNYYAATLAATGRRHRALALYQQALAMNRELNKPDDEAISLEGIAEHHLATGGPTEGTAHLYQALEIYRRLGMTPDTRRVESRLTGLTA